MAKTNVLQTIYSLQKIPKFEFFASCEQCTPKGSTNPGFEEALIEILVNLKFQFSCPVQTHPLFSFSVEGIYCFLVHFTNYWTP